MKKVINAIQQYVPGCEQEKADKELFLHVAKNLPDALTRDNNLVHFTTSAFVINPSKTKVVSTYHNIYDSWNWMGGHNDGDDNFLRVAKKEIREESGIKNLVPLTAGIFSIESMPVLGHVRRGKYVTAHVHLNVSYVFIASEKENIRIEADENSDIAWLGLDELIEKSTEPHMKPVYRKIIDRIRGHK